jgi:hypothetical protein
MALSISTSWDRSMECDGTAVVWSNGSLRLDFDCGCSRVAEAVMCLV